MLQRRYLEFFFTNGAAHVVSLHVTHRGRKNRRDGIDFLSIFFYPFIWPTAPPILLALMLHTVRGRKKRRGGVEFVLADGAAYFVIF